jgi:hypothetical protein
MVFGIRDGGSFIRRSCGSRLTIVDWLIRTVAAISPSPDGVNLQVKSGVPASVEREAPFFVRHL